MIVVLGMHRSGSSLVAGLLHKLGVNMGERFREPDEFAPDGYWEDLDFRDLNRDILKAAGGSWWEPPAEGTISSLEEQFRSRIAGLILDRMRKPRWGFKDPRTALTIPALHPSLAGAGDGPRYVVVERDEDEIVASLERRAEARGYSEPRKHWVELTRLYYERILQFLDEVDSPRLFVSYSHLTDRMYAEGVVRRLAKFARVPFDPEVLSFIKLRSSRNGLLYAERKGDYRAGVGPRVFYDVISAHIFSLLTRHGLREHHKLLDVGCGSLRVGRLFIIYLRKGNYFGVEPNFWLVEEAIKQELGQEILDLKSPFFSESMRFEFSEFNTKFDFALANSIFTHAPRWQIELCFEELARVMRRGGRFYATYKPGVRDYKGEDWASDVLVPYKPATIAALASRAGFSFRHLEDRHPTRQQWFETVYGG